MVSASSFLKLNFDGAYSDQSNLMALGGGGGVFGGNQGNWIAGFCGQVQRLNTPIWKLKLSTKGYL